MEVKITQVFFSRWRDGRRDVPGHVTSSLTVKMEHCDWTEEKMEYFLLVSRSIEVAISHNKSQYIKISRKKSKSQPTVLHLRIGGG